ncbi:MAG: alpha/beta fold hydrolase [Myxococcota bacterium]
MDLLASANQALRHVLRARGVRSTFVRAGGQAVHYYALGGVAGRTPLVLVHGLGGSANGFYKTFLPLSRRFGQVFALDLPGNGFSPLPPTGPSSLRALLAVLAGFLDEVVRTPAYVVGNSLGGALAATLAHERPEVVRALGLVAPAGAQVAKERMQELFSALDVQGPAAARSLTRRLFHRAPLPLLLLTGELRKLYSTEAVKAVVAEAQKEETLFLAPQVLQSIQAPTLLLWGKSEKLLPFEGVDYFRAHLPAHARIEVVEGFGHVPQMERPAQLVEHLVRFADAHSL